jgi:hypothetical protein
VTSSSKARNRVELPTDSQVLADFERGRLDIPFFAWRFLGIKANPGQEEWWNMCAERGANGYGPHYLTTVVSAGNRAGKTLGLDVLAFHHTLYKLGLKPPADDTLVAAKAWLMLPFDWYHIAPQQSMAENVQQEIALILSGHHPAQGTRGCPLRQEFGPMVDVTTKERGEYLMVTIHPLFGGGRIHFRTAQEKAKALLGLNMHGISYDEAGAELHLYTVYQEVLNFRRLSTGGPLHFVGTPLSEMVEYRDLWELGNPQNPSRDPRVISLRLPTDQNIGFGVSQEDYDALKRQQDPYLIPQNLGGEFVEALNAYFGAPAVEAAFVGDKVACPACQGTGIDLEMDFVDPLDSYTCSKCEGERTVPSNLQADMEPVNGHNYVQGVDPGIASDATWAITLDFTNPKEFIGVRAVRKTGRQSIPGVVNMVREGHLLYSQDGTRCTTIVDSTGMGGKMAKQEFSIISPLRDFDFAGTKSKKLNLLSDLHAALDKGMLKLPRSGGAWGDLRRQLLSYRLDDRKLTQDAVMALAMAVHHALRNSGEGVPPVFRFFGDPRPIPDDFAKAFGVQK